MKGFVIFACVCVAWGAPASNKGKLRFYLFLNSLLKYSLFSDVDHLYNDKKSIMNRRQIYELVCL